MLRSSFLAILFLGCFFLEAFAQNPLYVTQHRPAGLHWQELNSPHFRIIFADGDEAIARRAARILESQYQITYELTGGTLNQFPVVLTTYNDLTNGFVSSVNFRSEVDLSPFKGKSLNPQSGSWLETVLPHELLHANHANVTNRFSVASFFGLLSPDFRRSFNLFPPLGVHEGLAVYHESEHGIRDYSGRSNYTYFQNQFNDNLMGANRWGMGQLLIPSEETQPANRHYIGGATFTKWLHQTYGDDTSKQAFRVHQNLFFLGYGYALRRVTGTWPSQLYKDFQKSQLFKEQNRFADIDSSTDRHQVIISSPYSGVRQQRPLWISDSEILYYSRQYNAPGALYVYDAKKKTSRVLSERFLVGDFYMDFEPETNHLFIAEHFSLSKLYFKYQPDIVRLNLHTGNESRISEGKRLYAPEKSAGTLYALQPNGDVSNIVIVQPNGVTAITDFKDRSAVAIKASPHTDGELAVLMNQRGIQAIWIVNKSSIQEDLNKPPVLAFKNGSIHDPVWHPTKNKLLFTMDAFPAMNVYEYDLESHKILQLTHSQFNAMEASYHPHDGSIVYVTQTNNERKIAILSPEHFFNKVVDEQQLLLGEDLKTALNTPFLGDELISESEQWQIKEYAKDAKWLKPRAILPITKTKSNTTEWGASLLSVDALQSQAYAFEITTLQNRLWYNASYENKTFFPGIGINVYNTPQYQSIRLNDGVAPIFLREEKGISIKTTFQHYFSKTDRFSSLYFRPSLAREQLRFNTLEPKPASNFSTEWKSTLFAQLNLRVLQKPRDIQPSSGVQVYVQIEDILTKTNQILTYGDQKYGLDLPKRRGVFYGANFYIAPFPKTNQSLELSAQFLTQSNQRLFSNDSIIPFGFENDLFSTISSIGRLSSRYTIPIAYVDNGGLLVPFYVSTIYLGLFSHTLFDYENTSPLKNSRALVGAELQFRFKISNLPIDIGLGLTYDVSRGTSDFYVGSF